MQEESRFQLFLSQNEVKSMASQQRKNGGGGRPRERERSGEERKQEMQFSGPIIIFLKRFKFKILSKLCI